MKMTMQASAFLPLALAATLLSGGCSKQPPTTAQQQTQVAPNAAGQQALNPEASPVQQAPPQAMQALPPRQQATSGYAPEGSARGRRREGASSASEAAVTPSSFTIPAGTHIRVTTGEELGSKLSQPGQSFSATVADPVTVNGVTVIRSGSSATGTVVDAKSLGRFKGQATLTLRLDSVHAEGRTYEVASSTIDRVESGKGKRTAVLTGGGGGLGALIGGLAGGGKGALIGGLAGAGAGGAGSAFTGNKEIVIPAETPLTFRLENAVTVGR